MTINLSSKNPSIINKIGELFETIIERFEDEEQHQLQHFLNMFERQGGVDLITKKLEEYGEDQFPKINMINKKYFIINLHYDDDGTIVMHTGNPDYPTISALNCLQNIIYFILL